METKVRIGVLGLGNMGSIHAKYIKDGEVKGAELTAVCDLTAERRGRAQEVLGQDIRIFEKKEDLFASGLVDAVIVATPHYDHEDSTVKAFAKGLHVMVEKPAGVYTKQVRRMNQAAADSGKVYSIMYIMRTLPIYQKLRDLIQSGELGAIRRTNWIVTDWYRSQSYYDSAGWRATWAGEGGGVLINQDPHQLDLWQWTTGLQPKRIRAFCAFGKNRKIEVEDEVTAYVEYTNGATGVFVTSTGEAPGTNRLEVTGDRGKIVIESGKMTFWRLRIPESQFNREYKGGFGEPECWKCDIQVADIDKGQAPHAGHLAVTQNWIDAILYGKPLLAPGEEGIHGLTLSNAMHLSTWTDGWVNLPIDEEVYYEMLQQNIQKSSVRKPTLQK